MPPRKVKMFPKTGKLNYINPSTESLEPLGSSFATGSTDPEGDEFRARLQLDLCWCIQSLEGSIASGKLNPQQVSQTKKNLKILKDNTQLVVRKRAIMSQACGDYRARMAAEELALRQKPSNIQFTKRTFVGSYFFKKSALQSMGKPFAFEFSVADRMNQLDLNGSEDAAAIPAAAAAAAAVPASAAAAVASGVSETNRTASSIALPSTDNSFKFNFNVDAE